MIPPTSTIHNILLIPYYVARVAFLTVATSKFCGVVKGAAPIHPLRQHVMPPPTTKWNAVTAPYLPHFRWWFPYPKNQSNHEIQKALTASLSWH